MRDLLADNIALINQLSSLQGHMPFSSLTPRPLLREVPSLVSWLYCFVTYVAVRTPDPLTRDMLAYARLLMREALRHGGNGWSEYDRVFRKQLVINPNLEWNSLLPSLQAATIFGYRPQGGGGTYCTLCQECDHSRSQCALMATEHPVLTKRLDDPSRPPRHPETLQSICIARNKASCYRPHCKFQHTCATCRLPHKAANCRATPIGSMYKPKLPIPTTRPHQGQSVSSSSIRSLAA